MQEVIAVTKRLRTGANRRSGLRNTAVVTAGEAFADGTVIELVSGHEPNKPDLLLWNGSEATIAARVEYGGCTYQSPELTASVYGATRFPKRCSKYESIRSLFTGIAALLARHLGLPERESKLVACFCVSTWLADCLPAAPGLVFCAPDQGKGVNALRLLGCLCRRPLILGEVTPASFRALPMYLRFTLLINDPAMTRRMRRLFCASSYNGLYVPGNRGVVLDLFGPKAVFAGMSAFADILGDEALQIFVGAAQVPLPGLDGKLQQEIANEFQPRLLMFRLQNHRRVRESKIDIPEFAFSPRQLVRNLVTCFPEDPELGRDIIQQLAPQDEDVRAQRASSIECAIVEVLMGLVHERKLREIRVGEVMNLVNVLLRSRGESFEYSAEELGWKLKALSLYRHRNSSGSQLSLDRDTSRRVHRLARSYDLPSSRPAAEGCPECAVSKVVVTG